MRLTRDDTRGPVDLGPSQGGHELPEDVRMPFRSFHIIEYTGNVSRRIDSLHCTIDPEGEWDNSRHVGIEHILNAQPHAQSRRFFPDSVPGTHRPEWVEDGQGGMRRINVLAVTLPHDCEKHLVEA